MPPEAHTTTPAAFVRTLPDASPADVVQAAAAAGLTLTETAVRKIRGLDKARVARWGDPSARKAPKAEYIRRVGAGLAPFKVVQKARMDGVTLTVADVAAVRAADRPKAANDASPGRKRAGRKPKAASQAIPPPAGAKAAPRKRAPAPPVRDAERAFRSSAAALILDLGVGRATEILNDVVARLRAAAD